MDVRPHAELLTSGPHAISISEVIAGFDYRGPGARYACKPTLIAVGADRSK